MPLRLALIDNYDSYTHNLAHLLARVNDGVPPLTILADAYPSLQALHAAHGQFDAFVLSPGPGTPASREDFAPLPAATLHTATPVLAVCLGHQALCLNAGATIARLPAGPRHGIVADVVRAAASHDCPLFHGVPASFRVVRYHSLAAVHLPPHADLVPTAWTTDTHPVSGARHDVLMAVRSRVAPRFGVQFHPESVASQYGARLAANFLAVAAAVRAAHNPVLQPRLHASLGAPPPRALPAPPHRHVHPAAARDGIHTPPPRFQTLVFERDAPLCDSDVLFDALLGCERPAFWLDSSTADRRNVAGNAPPTGNATAARFGSVATSPIGGPRKVQRGEQTEGLANGDGHGNSVHAMDESTGSTNGSDISTDDGLCDETLQAHAEAEDGGKHGMDGTQPQGEGQQQGGAQQPRGRFSVMGPFNGPLGEAVTYDSAKQEITVRATRDGSCTKLRATIFDYLQHQLWCRRAPQPDALPIELNGGYVGYLGYEVKRDAPGVRGNAHASSLPDAWFVFADRLLVLDHLTGRLFLVALVPRDDACAEAGAREWFCEMDRQLDAVERDAVERDAVETAETAGVVDAVAQGLREGGVMEPEEGLCGEGPLKFTLERGRDEYMRDIGACLDYILDGETYEVCLTNRLRTRLPAAQEVDPFAVYRTLRRTNPAPYSAYVRLDEATAVCCSSPERFLQISAGGRVESKPIKGTVKRGATHEEDARLRDGLQSSEKERAENLMIVDLVRNDVSRACEVASVRVPKLMAVESYATVHQLVSTVEGRLRPGAHATACVHAAYPMGSMTGAPKVRTMQLIDGLERSARGVYSGTIGFLAASGAADLNVVIRAAVLRGGRDVEIGVGGAIVALSEPACEFDEIVLKGAAVMRAVATAATGGGDYAVA